VRKPQPLPFADQLDARVKSLVRRYTQGRDGVGKDVLSPAQVGEVAWGVGTLWDGFTGKRELISADYLAKPELLHAYMLYYLPRSYVQARLAFRHLVGKKIHRMLDLGSGPGPLLMAGIDAFGLQPGSDRLWAVDHDARAMKLAAELTGAQTAVSKLPQLPPGLTGKTFDLVSLGLVVNELWKGSPDAVAKRAAWLQTQVLPLVAEGGHLVIVEPALKETGREALQLRDLLVKGGLEVVAPCTRQGACPALEKERDWCHAGVRYDPPAAAKAIGKSVGIDPSDLRFFYLVLRRPTAPVAATDALRVVSEPLVEKGRTKIWVCGEGGRVLLDRQDKHRAEANAVFDALSRDDLVRVTGTEVKAESLRLLEGSTVAKLQGATTPDRLP
jgi:ribosomal protein RSM22 (predicted rRNA methylase)